MKKKKFSKVRFYRRLKAQQLSTPATGYFDTKTLLNRWKSPFFGYPNLTRGARIATEELVKFGEILGRKFQDIWANHQC